VTIWERVESALTGLGMPMAADAYLVETGAALPDEYLVYGLISDVPLQYADDTELNSTQHVEINYLSRIGLPKIGAITAAMKAAGFTRGARTKLPYIEPSRHFGINLEFNYLEEE
jgi:hypothetical protein